MEVVAATMLALALVVAPVKPYVHPDEPVEVRFAQASDAKAAKMIDACGWKALDAMPEVFAPAADAVKDGKPAFKVYTFAGKELEPKSASVDAKAGVLDVAAFYPQIREEGTYILTWNNATPLVISTRANPGLDARARAMIPREQLAKVPADMFKPVITQIMPLQYAVISTDKGDIQATFAYDVAPHTVENFMSLAEAKFYDDTAFHRVIRDFMIQGGDSLAKTDRAGSGGPGYNVNQEFSDRPHVRGVLSMARLGNDVNSAGSQFFIVLAKKDYLDGKYTVFGQVLKGMDVVDEIAKTPVTDDNGSTKVKDRVGIKSVRIKPATADMYGIKQP